MEVVRILPLDDKHYDFRKQRFRDIVYRRSSSQRGGGFSVVGTSCVDARGIGIHVHIKQYYGAVPCGLWRFDTIIFEPPKPNPRKIRQPKLVQETDPAVGDLCHYNLYHVSDNRLEKMYKKAAKNADGAGELLLLYTDGATTGFTARGRSRFAERACSSSLGTSG